MAKEIFRRGESGEILMRIGADDGDLEVFVRVQHQQGTMRLDGAGRGYGLTGTKRIGIVWQVWVGACEVLVLWGRWTLQLQTNERLTLLVHVCNVERAAIFGIESASGPPGLISENPPVSRLHELGDRAKLQARAA